ncbi:UTR2 [Candida pseudojiufengensis]|uniref:UTR2 n=1 Tax=Candida pseudojiufengensis TaxID=497109 RepID=UPI002224957C|nr:UTR2 [Candida pseudojiufengensis]KAI5959098.1 UTR2 [Candida pseudojiufengensis]
MKSIYIIFISLLSYTLADTILCNSTQSCPESSPCCSQFGICGSGAYCLGGCDIRYSYNLTACMPMPRMYDYQKTFDSKDDIQAIELQTEYLGNASEADWVYTGWVDYYDNALLLQMPNHTTGTVVSSTKYLWYGKIGATLKTSHGGGVVSAFILFSDVQDEIDFEYVGYDLVHPQSNYYAQGILNYNNSRNSSVNNTFEYYHLYEMDWHEDHITWSVDNKDVRTLNKNDTWNDTTKRYDFPQTPSRIQFSLWPGGDPQNGQGTIEWAGGEIDWNAEDIQKYGYFYAHVKEIHVETHDFPSNVTMKDGNSTNEEDYHAFLYDSTKGNEENIYLTNKKTWLGSDEATGFDPQNEDDDVFNKNITSTIISTSGSSVITSIHTTQSKATANAVAQNTAAANQATAAQQNTNNNNNNNGYQSTNGIGGFVQFSNPTGSTTGGSNGVAVAYSNNNLSNVFVAIALGIFSYLF